MKLRLASPKILIDINGLADLTQVREENGEIVVGALTRHDQLANNSIIRKRIPLLAEAASVIADQQVRNRGTIGGSLAHADPTADLPTASTTLAATIIAASTKGTRSIKSSDFFRDYFTTSLRQDEIVKEVRVPIPPPGSGGAYLKLSKGQNDFAVVAVAVLMTLGDGIVCRAASVVLGGVASTPVHAKETERFLVGRRLDDGAIKDGAQKAAEGLNPPSDIRGSAEYRLEIARTLTNRAIALSVGRARRGA